MLREIATPFRSFWMGGFESATHVNRHQERVDMVAGTQHDRFVRSDYARLRTLGIQVAREGVRWPLIETSPGHYDLTSVRAMASAARDTGVQVLWSFCHYGWPDDLDLFSPAFVSRFADYCGVVAAAIADAGETPLQVTPVNEISFFAWAAGEVGCMRPFATKRGGEVKRQLVRAWLAGVDAIRAVDPAARVIAMEPMVTVLPNPKRPKRAGDARRYHESQYEACEMVSGAMAPELGGAPHYLDLVGVNFYADNQWEHPGGKKIEWHRVPRDARWVPLHQMLAAAAQRYKRPLVIGETSHVGVGRAPWLAEVTHEAGVALRLGVPLRGICLYPIIDRYDWDDRCHWHHSGLWDLVRQPNGELTRVLDQHYAAELRLSMRRLRDGDEVSGLPSKVGLEPAQASA